MMVNAVEHRTFLSWGLRLVTAVAYGIGNCRGRRVRLLSPRVRT